MNLRQEKKSTEKTNKTQKGRNVTWRDEAQQNDTLEGKVAACAAERCNFFAFAKQGMGIADTLSPDSEKAKALKDMWNKSQEKETTDSKENDSAKANTTTITTKPVGSEIDGASEKMATKTQSRKVVYDDEGKPMYEDGTEVPMENMVSLPQKHSCAQKDASG